MIDRVTPLPEDRFSKAISEWLPQSTSSDVQSRKIPHFNGVPGHYLSLTCGRSVRRLNQYPKHKLPVPQKYASDKILSRTFLQLYGTSGISSNNTKSMTRSKGFKKKICDESWRPLWASVIFKKVYDTFDTDTMSQLDTNHTNSQEEDWSATNITILIISTRNHIICAIDKCYLLTLLFVVLLSVISGVMQMMRSGVMSGDRRY